MEQLTVPSKNFLMPRENTVKANQDLYWYLENFKEEVDEVIRTMDQKFMGTYDSLEELEQVEADENDYAYVRGVDVSDNPIYNKYRYVEGEGWQFEFVIADPAFTEEQWAAVNSGITSEIMQALATKVQGATAGNLAALDSGGNIVDSGKSVQDLTVSVSQNTITLSDWTANTDYVVGNQRQNNGHYYRCTTDHTSGETFNVSDGWVEIPEFDLWGENVQTINIGGESKPIYQLLVKIKGWAASAADAHADNLGDIFYQTGTHGLRKRIATSGPEQFSWVPYIDGAIYTYNNQLYVWDGANLVCVGQDMSSTIDEVESLNVQVNGENVEHEIEVTYSNGYIATSGAIGGTGSSSYKHTNAIAITDDILSLKAYTLTSDQYAGGIGFYKTATLPTSSGEALQRTVEVVGIGTTTQSGNTIVEINNTKLAELKAAGAKYFAVCIVPTGAQGVFSYTYQRGVRDDIEDLNTDISELSAEIDTLNGNVNKQFENLREQEYEVTNYGLLVNTLTSKLYDSDGSLVDQTAYNSTTLALLDRENNIWPYLTGNGNYIVYFDENKQFISRMAGIKRDNPARIESFPSNAKYVAFSWIKTDLLSDVFATRNQKLDRLGWKIYANVIKRRKERVTININPTDSETEILKKLIIAMILGDSNVRFGYGEYYFSDIYNSMVTDWGVGLVQGAYQRELPLGRNCHYDLCGSTIIGSLPTGVSDAKIFGNMRTPGNDYEIYNGKIINNGMVYAIHDEGQNQLPYYKHSYRNLEIVNNNGGEAGIGLGTGIDGIVNVDKCIFLTDDTTKAGIAGHGITDSSVTDDARFELNITNTYFQTNARVTVLGTNQVANFAMSGCSVTTLYSTSNWNKYFFANEVRG